jgi:hypothetical protein
VEGVAVEYMGRGRRNRELLVIVVEEFLADREMACGSEAGADGRTRAVCSGTSY